MWKEIKIKKMFWYSLIHKLLFIKFKIMEKINVNWYKEVIIDKENGIIKTSGIDEENENVNNELKLNKPIMEIKPIEVIKRRYDGDFKDNRYYILETEDKNYLLAIYRKNDYLFVLSPDIADIKWELDRIFGLYLDEKYDYRPLESIDIQILVYSNYLYNSFFKLNENFKEEDLKDIKKQFHIRFTGHYNDMCIGSTNVEDFLAEDISIKIDSNNIKMNKKYGQGEETLWDVNFDKIDSVDKFIISLILLDELYLINDVNIINFDPYVQWVDIDEFYYTFIQPIEQAKLEALKLYLDEKY